MTDYKVVDATQLDADLESVADAIRAKTGGADKLNFPNEYVSEIQSISGGEVTEKDVNFYDYDGTLLYGYTLAEIEAMTELPPAPTPKKDFLEFVEWNWTLDQIKATALPNTIGATYRTIDGKTRAVVVIESLDNATITMNWKSWMYDLNNSYVSIDWGDGSAVETVRPATTGSQVFQRTHIYSTTGTYTILLNTNSTFDFGDTSTLPFIGTSKSDNSTWFLRELYVGDNAEYRFLAGACQNARKIEVVTMSKRNGNIWANAFDSCSSLKAIIQPSGATALRSYSLYKTISIKRISLAPTLTTMEYYTMANSAVEKLTIPSGVTAVNIGSGGVLKEVHLAEGITKIDTNGIDDKRALKQFVLPSTLTEIANAACTNLACVTKLVIPENVTTIGDNAFNNNDGSKNLLLLKFKPTTPPTLAASNAFAIPADCVVEVPAASLTAYQSATNYANLSAQMVGV